MTSLNPDRPECAAPRGRVHTSCARDTLRKPISRSFADASATSTAPRVDEKLPGASLSPEGRLRRGCGGGVRASRRPRRALHVPFERLVSRSVSGGFVSTLRLGEHSPQPRIKNLIRQRARHRRVNQPGRIRRERHSRGGRRAALPASDAVALPGVSSAEVAFSVAGSATGSAAVPFTEAAGTVAFAEVAFSVAGSATGSAEVPFTEAAGTVAFAEVAFFVLGPATGSAAVPFT